MDYNHPGLPHSPPHPVPFKSQQVNISYTLCSSEPQDTASQQRDIDNYMANSICPNPGTVHIVHTCAHHLLLSPAGWLLQSTLLVLIRPPYHPPTALTRPETRGLANVMRICWFVCRPRIKVTGIYGPRRSCRFMFSVFVGLLFIIWLLSHLVLVVGESS